jgi:hypothetical protein
MTLRVHAIVGLIFIFNPAGSNSGFAIKLFQSLFGFGRQALAFSRFNSV